MATEKWKMPDEQKCVELDLPHRLVCRRGHIISSRIGITEREFDSVYAHTLPRVKMGKRWRYSTAGVIQAFTGTGSN